MGVITVVCALGWRRKMATGVSGTGSAYLLSWQCYTLCPRFLLVVCIGALSVLSHQNRVTARFGLYAF